MTKEKKEVKRCGECGASMKIWKQTLSVGLVEILMLVAKTTLQKRDRAIHMQNDVQLTNNQYTNFHKLRYFGLLHHAKDSNGEKIPGKWIVTRNGWDYLRGDIAMPNYVDTFRNKVTGKSEDYFYIYEKSDLPKEYFSGEFGIAPGGREQAPACSQRALSL